jgi:2-oxo-4-hydroxy-4-carboxy--5-ureidoimidazoline (OHCU) decarboxylase
MLEASPQLLSEEFTSRLGQRVTELEQKGMTETARFVDGHRALLAHCRQVGVDQAFAEEMEQDPDGLGRVFLRVTAGMQAFAKAAEEQAWQDCNQVLDAYPELLEPYASRILEEVMISNDSRGSHPLKRFQMLLTRCGAVGREQALAEMRKAQSMGLRDALLLFLAAPSDEDARRVVAAHPELLSYAAQLQLSERIEDAAASSETRVFVPFLEEQQRILADGGEITSSRTPVPGHVAPGREPRPAQVGELSNVVLDFLAAPSWDARSVIVDEHPELLTCTAEELLNDLIAKAAAERPDMVEGLGNCRDVLADARRVGFDAAVELATTKGEAGRRRSGG